MELRPLSVDAALISGRQADVVQRGRTCVPPGRISAAARDLPGALPEPRAKPPTEGRGIVVADLGSDHGNGGLHMVDLAQPDAPVFAGCFADDGYTHDVQCVNYKGPDENFHDREICFASNEDSVTIVDVTDKGNPVQLSKIAYPGAAYTHQGWLDEWMDG